MANNPLLPAQDQAPALPKLLFSEQETAEVLGGVHPKTVYNLRRAGKLAYVRVGTGARGRIMYPLAAIQEYLTANMIAANGQQPGEGAKR